MGHTTDNETSIPSSEEADQGFSSSVTQAHPIDLTKDKSSYESDLSAHHLERVTAISEAEEQAFHVEDVTTSAEVDQHALRLEGITTEQILDFWLDGPRKVSTSENPENLVFLDYGRNSHPCDCSHGCVREQCSNAEVGIYCTPENCASDGRCSNSVYDCQEVELFQTQFGYGLRATGFISVGSVHRYIVNARLQQGRGDDE
ncbi:hypothetical protein JG687_00011226 [Phytophthora cactorum]|uniref:Uncharacterized protein n=1 Tax=Phytophthora cactorum TaxID=29920 RepID=A0A8T1UA93_9STRA|nr:hypothetical protein JG687_00011226 [Phytophthora cactorum]